MMPAFLTRRPRRATWLVVPALLFAGGDGGRPGFPTLLPRLPELVRLEPGLEVGRGTPAGWSHRVIRSIPHLASGEREGLPRSAEATATRFRTVIAADVAVASRSGYRLARVGIANAVPVDSGELTVARDGPPEALATLGVVDRVVLRAAEARLDRGRLISRTPTFALFRTPTVMVVNGQHREVDLCYALLVDPETGDLSTLCWPMPCDAPADALPATVTQLKPDLTFEVALDVRVTRRVGPVPVSWSFAMASPPPGVALDLPETLRQSISLADPIAFERALRSLL